MALLFLDGKFIIYSSITTKRATLVVDSFVQYFDRGRGLASPLLAADGFEIVLWDDAIALRVVTGGVK